MKTLISTLILGAGLVLGGCGNKEFTGEVISEETGEKMLGQTYREYIVKDEKGYEHFAIINERVIDPFNKGDFVKVKLGDVAVVYPETYVDGKLTPQKKGYEIVEYEILKKNLNKK